MTEIKRALELGPLSLIINVLVGWHFYASGQYNEATEQWQKTLEMEPNFFLPHWMFWRVFGLKGMHAESLAECRKTFSLLGNIEVVEAIEQSSAGSGYKGAMRQAAQTLVAQSKERYVPLTDIAVLYAHAEEKGQAIVWLEKAYEERDLRLYSVGVEPDWQSLRHDARFQALL